MAHTGLSFLCHQMVKSKLFGRRKTTLSLLSEKADPGSQQEVLLPEEKKPSPVPTVPWELPHAFHVPLSAHQAESAFSTSWDPTGPLWNSHMFSFCECSRSHLGRIPYVCPARQYCKQYVGCAVLIMSYRVVWVTHTVWWQNDSKTQAILQCRSLGIRFLTLSFLCADGVSVFTHLIKWKI